MEAKITVGYSMRLCLIVLLMFGSITYILLKPHIHVALYLNKIMSMTETPRPRDILYSNSSTSSNKNTKCARLTVEFKGRMGNVMFEYASLLGIADTNNMCAHITMTSSWLHDSFNINKDTVEPVDQWYDYPKTRHMVYDTKTQHLIHRDTVLHGHLQSWKYFEHIKLQILKKFEFCTNVKQKGKEILEQIDRNSNVHKNRVIKIGVHVRRGDMAAEYSQQVLGFVLPGKAYFTKAMKYFRDKYKNVIFVVSSNGLDWARSNVKGSDVMYLAEGTSPEVAMATLTLCDHTIMSSGSFSWWIAYLTQGEVIYYRRFPKSGTFMGLQTNKADYYHYDWIGMD